MMFSASLEEPERQPSKIPNTAAIRKPQTERSRLIAMSVGTLSRNSQPAITISSGVGIIVGGTQRAL